MPIDFREREREARELARDRLDEAERFLASGDPLAVEEELRAGSLALGRALAYSVPIVPGRDDDLPRLVSHIGEEWFALVIERMLAGDLREVELRGYLKFLRTLLDLRPSVLAER